MQASFAPSPVALLAVEIAIREARLGVIESAGQNRGPEVDEYQLEANGVVGQMWCAKFVWWCFERAASKLHTKNPFPRMFLSSALSLWAMRENRVVKQPAPGDVLVKQLRHTGIVAGPVVGGRVPAVEGNTYIGRPAKPDGVYETSKTVAVECTFFRL